ncbi:MAG: hypothetical protein JKY65_14885 [Planctomycetes bacterium]|nr:hypothetical protein [Planctomycetota bacterium]
MTAEFFALLAESDHADWLASLSEFDWVRERAAGVGGTLTAFAAEPQEPADLEVMPAEALLSSLRATSEALNAILMDLEFLKDAGDRALILCDDLISDTEDVVDQEAEEREDS